MQYNREYEPEINMKDLFFHVLYRWRSLLIAALIGALLAGGYQYLSVRKSRASGKQSEAEQTYQAQLQEYQEQKAVWQDQIDLYTRRLREEDDYAVHSPYMRLNPQRVWTSVVQYQVRAEQPSGDVLPAADPADSVLPVYLSPFSGEGDMQELAGIYGTDRPEYAGEMVSVTADATFNTVTVTAFGETEEAARKAGEFVNGRLEALHAGAAGDIAPHQLVRISGDVRPGENTDVFTKQSEVLLQMDYSQKRLITAQDQTEDLKKPKKSGSRIPKMALLGLILGAAALFLFYAARYAMSGRLNDSRDLTEQYGLPLFGEFRKSGSVHGGRGPDRLLEKWERGRNRPDDAKVFDDIAALIAEHDKTDRLLLVSTLPEERLVPVREALSERLPDTDLEIRADFLKDSKALSEASGSESVILVEEKQVSRRGAVGRMAEMLMISKVNVIGAIVL